MTTTIPFRMLAALVAGALILPAPARAARWIVEKGGEFPTIQAAVDAAGPGDRILVRPGVYQENVIIPANKSGLRLKAVGAVVIEARAALGLGQGPGLWIDCAGVTVEGFRIQNAAADPNPPYRDGHGIQTTREGLTLLSVHFRNNAAAALMAPAGAGTTIQGGSSSGDARPLEITGDNVVVREFEVDSPDQGGLLFSGNSISVSKCRITNCDGPAIDLSGPSALIFGNQVTSCRGPGIKVTGSWAKIRKNTVRSARDDGVLVEGHDTICNDNRILHTASGAGVRLIGDDQTARGNEVRHSAAAGLLVAGENAGVHDNLVVGPSGGPGLQVVGDHPLITGNRVQDALDDQSGIQLQGVVTSGLLDGNRVENVSNSGIVVASDCFNLTLRNNVVVGAGNEAEAGYVIRGGSHLLFGNTARGNAGDGFNVLGEGIVLNGNLSVRNGRDGYDLEGGSEITVNENRARKNGAEGVENNAAGTVITDNWSKQNRIDFANDNLVTTFTGNASGDGSDDTTLPEID